MLSFLIKRLLGTIPVVLMVMIAVFAFVHLLPGDPARLVAGPRPPRRTLPPFARPWAWTGRCPSNS